jgi:radical SAM protein with 4Fe4S-binding SPASM domain
MSLSNLLNLWRKGYSYYHSKAEVSSYPVISGIESTNACGMQCRMCPRSHMKRSVGFISLELFEKIASQMKYNKIVSLHHFGDPLLHPQIGELINILHKYNIQASFSTNPQMLNDKNIAAILDSQLDRLNISLDGATKETYESLRGGIANYELALEGINRLLKEKLRRKSDKPYILISMIEMKDTEKEVSEFKSRWTPESGINEVQIKPFICWDGTDKDINKMADDSHLNKSFKKKQDYPCFWPYSRLVILWNGLIVPCCYCYDYQVILGDLNKQTIEEVWNSKTMQNFRKMQIDNNFPEGHLCKLCHEKEGSPPSKWFPFNMIFKGKLNLASYFKYN